MIVRWGESGCSKPNIVLSNVSIMTQYLLNSVRASLVERTVGRSGGNERKRARLSSKLKESTSRPQGTQASQKSDGNDAHWRLEGRIGANPDGEAL